MFFFLFINYWESDEVPFWWPVRYWQLPQIYFLKIYIKTCAIIEKKVIQKRSLLVLQNARTSEASVRVAPSPRTRPLLPFPHSPFPPQYRILQHGGQPPDSLLTLLARDIVLSFLFAPPVSLKCRRRIISDARRDSLHSPLTFRKIAARATSPSSQYHRERRVRGVGRALNGRFDTPGTKGTCETRGRIPAVKVKGTFYDITVRDMTAAWVIFSDGALDD